MSLEKLLTQEITIIRSSQAAPIVDAEGNVRNAPGELALPGLIQQQEATEIRIGPDTFISDHRLFLGADAQIEGRDRIREGGRVFEIVGQPDRVWHPRLARVDHIEVNLRLTTA